MGKRATSRWGTRLAVVLAFTVLGNVAISGVAAAASRSCTGRAAELCPTSTRTNERSTETITDEITPVTDSPATVSEPVEPEATAPSAPATSTIKAGAVRMDHEHHDSEPDPQTGVDPDCDEDDANDVDEGDDDEDCTGGNADPEPCDDDADDEADEDEGEDADEDDCVDPEPPVEICDDGIDNNEDGEVDEDCEAPEPPEPGVLPPPVTVDRPTVLPRQIDRLPTTGADVTSLFLIGLTLVAIGGASRIRTSPVRVVFAGQGSVAELILIQYLNYVATQRTIRRRRR